MSSCKGEGQTVINNGTAISDRQCGCDYSNGYDFVTKPKHPCFCVPSEEDCSCYFRSCPAGFFFTPGISLDRNNLFSTLQFYCDIVNKPNLPSHGLKEVLYLYDASYR